jgi:hypothetical protein
MRVLSYNMVQASSEEEGPWLEPVCHAGRAAPGAHRFSVSAACWWATDTGMFITGSHDKQVGEQMAVKDYVCR